MDPSTTHPTARPRRRTPSSSATHQQAHAGVLAAYAAVVLGVTGFVMLMLAPRETGARALDARWITAALADWASILAAVIFLIGLRALAGRVRLAGEVAFVVAVTATSAGGAMHSRVLVDYAAFGIDVGFATRLHDTQTTFAEIIFAVLALSALSGWAGVAAFLGSTAGLSRTGRIAIAVAGAGVMLALPVTALALLAAGIALSSALHRSEAKERADRAHPCAL